MIQAMEFIRAESDRLPVRYAAQPTIAANRGDAKSPAEQKCFLGSRCHQTFLWLSTGHPVREIDNQQSVRILVMLLCG
jgi:hypothetical protein